MIKLKETARSSGRDDAIKFVKNLVATAEGDGYKQTSDIVVARKRGLTPGSNCYDAYVWLAKEG
jgi:hypothetical protein